MLRDKNKIISKREEVIEMVQAYCVKCKKKREMQNATAVTMKNGKPAMKGVCPVCGCGMYRIGKAS